MSMKDELVEQKITKQVTIADASSDKVQISIPANRTVYLKGYGYTYFSGVTYRLSTGAVTFPARTDQEGSPAIPMIFGKPYHCREGNYLTLYIDNASGASRTFDVVFYILTNELLPELSTGGELSIPIGGSGGLPASVAILDSTGTITADVIARGDGRNALCVDTEMVVHAEGSTFMIDNIEVGSTDGTSTNGKMLRTDSNGMLILTPTVASAAAVKITNGTNTASVSAGGALSVADATLAAVDFATETTLSSIAALDFATETTLTSIAGLDFATETTLTTIAGLDFATETTLSSIAALDFATETTLTTIAGLDFATETTLASIAALDFATETTLTSIAGLDFATETTLSSIAALDFATETSLGLLTANEAALTPTHSAPAIAAASTSALAANSSRKSALFINDSNETIYLNITGNAAVSNTGIRLNANGGSFEMSAKNGNLTTLACTAICASGGKTLLVTEFV